MAESPMNPFMSRVSIASDGQSNTMPLPGGLNNSGSLSKPLQPPNLRQFSSLSPSIGMDSPRDSVVYTDTSSGPLAAGAALAGAPEQSGGNPAPNEKTGPGVGKQSGRRRRLAWFAGLAALVVVAAAVAVPVGVVFGRNKSSSSSSDGGSGSNTKSNLHTTGGNGSTVTTEDGTTFTYVNPFGGFWVDDPEDPFNNNAQPNSWTPPLNTTWTWGVDKVYGVNLGGWFVLEPFIAPALFQKYQNLSTPVVDEWTLSQAMAADTSPDGGLSQIEDHYNTFITEQDIAQIAGAGLNWIRLPIPFWTVDKWTTTNDTEPFLAHTSWKYTLRLFRWARKYGLRINLDLHTAPGSQNGFNHSGKSGQINFLNGIMGFANAQRMLEYIRVIAEFISQQEYNDLIPMFGIINEPLTGIIGQDQISNFYLQAYDMIRNITGTGERKGAFISIHDGFESLTSWADFFPGSDRINLDTHPYFAFGAQFEQPIERWPPMACSWGGGINVSQTAFGVTVAGEFSNGINDCGLYLNGVGSTPGLPDCDFYMDSTQWNQTMIDGIRDYALASMDALQNWFFWTWKVGNSSVTNTVQSPLWSYQLGLEGGWMPTDPRSAAGKCAELGVTGIAFDGSYSAWQTGGSGAGTISATARESFAAWPPSIISGITGDLSLVPTYTSTAVMKTLPPDMFTAAPKTLSVGDGWADPADMASGVTEVAGCSYPDPWMALGLTLPTATCTGTVTPARLARRMVITPLPIA
ncbi:hypothetical protein EW145_g3127 [Phellinidium pouzarii]|uniref:glucan 1,3-beta-glucosidase n=1 Tax=Phellinidium pouzarii TaxID=167371 RepID=A0A4S4L8Q1_9AGAM|nr:hypothetical protein EW145_g3127 [Phellinidium pouzarii]